MQAVAAAAGHPIALELDPKITRSHSGSGLEAVLAHTARTVEHDLAQLQREDPAAFARQVTRLAKVECRYGSGGPHDYAWEGTTFVLTRPYQWEILAEGDLGQALRSDFYDDLERRFGNLAPEQVAAPDRGDYFVFLTGVRRHGDKPRPPEPVIERVVRLAAALGSSDPKLGGEVRAWLFRQANDFANTTRAEGQTADGKRAHAAWVAWLNAALTDPRASPSEKLLVARAVFGRSTVYGTNYREVDNEIDGFDAFVFGLGVADAWVAAGHPTRRAPGDAAYDLVDFVLAPPYYESDGHLSRGDGAQSPWVRRAFTNDASMRRLTDALAARGDPTLTAAVVYNLPRIDKVPVRTNFLRDLERQPRVWQLAVLVLVAEERRDGCDDGLVEEANRVWRDVPLLRGTALHVITCKEAHWRGVSDGFFARFSRLYGQSIGAPLLGAFLDDGPEAMKLADAIWPALSKGWSRADVIAPRLDAFLADPGVRAGSDGEPMRTLLALSERLCDEGNVADVSRFHEALAVRARRDPAQARALARVLDETQPGRCSPKPKRR
jgi:hypothetical protein